MASAVRSRTHSFGHPLASAVLPLPLTLPFLIPIKYLTLSTSPSQVSSFGHPVTRTTLNPVLTLLPPVPTNTGSFGYYSQYPSSVPHPIIRGPNSPSDAIPTIKNVLSILCALQYGWPSKRHSMFTWRSLNASTTGWSFFSPSHALTPIEPRQGWGRERESMPVGATHWNVNILILLKTLLGVKWINRWLTYVIKRLKTMLQFPQANQVRVTLTRLSENYAEYIPAALILKCLYIFPLFLPDT